MTKNSSLFRWLPSDKDFSHFKRFSHLYGTTLPDFPSTLGRQRRAILDQSMNGEQELCTEFQGAIRAGYKFGQDFSRRWQGMKESDITGQLILNGTDPRTAMKVALSFGALPLSAELPRIAVDPDTYLDQKNWPVTLDKLAIPYLETAYNLVDGPYDPFDNIRAVLQQAFQENEVVLVFSAWYEEWNNTNGVMPMPTSQSTLNHAHLFIDWTTINGEPMLVDHLSQGTAFADGGFGFFGREIVNREVENGNMGCYIFRQHPAQNAILNTISELDEEAIDFAGRIVTALTKHYSASNGGTMNETNAQKFVAAAKASLDHNLSEGTGVPYYVACAISVNRVHTSAFGFPIGGGASTTELYQALVASSDFKQTTTPTPGCVVISPTGHGSKPAYPHGHVGIVGEFGICSNDSETGLFSENYTVESWNQQFNVTEGYPVFYFERL